MISELTKCAEKITLDYQNGFRTNRVTTDNVYTLGQVIRKGIREALQESHNTAQEIALIIKKKQNTVYENK
jgi:hypothetical protein